ncbi:hypothetical protein FRAHR75_1950002 [Frankia sp. Hr75.2]|nr:hypothetical protein FRAHR75_1950002 [Frankia sp. Hr75.2]
MSAQPVLAVGLEVTPTRSHLGQLSRIRAHSRSGCRLEVTFPTVGDAPPVECWTWTRGGDRLGDELDILIGFYRLTVADLFAAADEHRVVSYDGSIRVAEIRLAPIMAAIRGRVRADRFVRAATAGVLATKPPDTADLVTFGPTRALAVSAHAQQQEAA